MPKQARPPEEVQKINRKILDNARTLIIKDGYDNFSMRKLAARLNVSATTIYRYYPSKAVLYLNILIKGFEEFLVCLNAAYDEGQTPVEKLKNFIKAYIDFGTKNANLYNIMMVYNVPKYYDFVGTPAEDVAKRELDTAIQVETLIERAIAESKILEGLPSCEKTAAALKMKCSVHGFISFLNSQITDYLSGLGNKIDREKVIDDFAESLITK